jgi:hypothetical protein
MEAKGKSFSLSGNAMHIKEWQIPKRIHYEPLLSEHYYPTEKEQKYMVCYLKTKAGSSDHKALRKETEPTN